MDVYAELSSRQQRPLHPTMAAPTGQTHLAAGPKMKFPLAPTSAVPETAISPPPMMPASNGSSQETLTSPQSSPQRGVNPTSTGSSPTKSASTSSSYEHSTNLTQFHPSNKPTMPLYRPAV